VRAEDTVGWQPLPITSELLRQDKTTVRSLPLATNSSSNEI
jgi:hypothetical protein